MNTVTTDSYLINFLSTEFVWDGHKGAECASTLRFPLSTDHYPSRFTITDARTGRVYTLERCGEDRDSVRYTDNNWDGIRVVIFKD